MRGSGDILGFQAEEVVRAYEKAVESGDTTHATRIRSAHPDLEARFAKVDSAADHAVVA